MKKIAKVLCMSAVVALAFSACKKNENNAQMFFGEAGELAGESEDRMYLQGNQFYFDAGDQVMMYNINNEDPDYSYYGTYTAASSGKTVQFTYQSGPIANHGDREDAFFAFYPGSIVDAGNLHDANQSIFSIAKEQTYKELNGVGTIPQNCMAFAAKDATNNTIQNSNFGFQAIMGVARLKLYDTNPAGPRTVTKIEYTDNTFNISGDVHLKINEVDPAEMTAIFNQYTDIQNPPANLAGYIQRVGYFVDGVNKGKTITLNVPGGVKLPTSKTDAKHFCIVLRPLALLGGGTFKVTFSDNSYVEIPVTNKIKPNVILNLTRNVNDF